MSEVENLHVAPANSAKNFHFMLQLVCVGRTSSLVGSTARGKRRNTGRQHAQSSMRGFRSGGDPIIIDMPCSIVSQVRDAAASDHLCNFHLRTLWRYQQMFFSWNPSPVIVES